MNAGGHALLLPAIYLWLAIPDRKVWQLAASASFGLVILFAALWLWTATFGYFRQVELRKALARVPAVAAWLALVIATMALAGWIADHFPRWSVWLGSWLTLRLHRPVHPETMARILSWSGWAVAWLVPPVLLVPVASRAAGIGFGGFRRWGVRRRFWLEYLAIFLAGAILPWKLITWVPEFQSFALQTVSLVLRFTAAWLLMVTAWLALARSAGRD
jgi:hypothetical protein